MAKLIKLIQDAFNTPASLPYLSAVSYIEFAIKV